MAHGSSCLHLVFGDRPRPQRSSLKLSHPRRNELVTPHESSPPCVSHRTMQQLEGLLKGAALTLDDTTLDRIDEIVPPDDIAPRCQVRMA